MSGFRAVNTTLTLSDPPPGRLGGETTPTTPRPLKFALEQPGADIKAEDPSAKTPTRDSFQGLAGQRPLPNAPFTPPSQDADTSPQDGVVSRESSHRSTASVASQDVKMTDNDKDDDDGESDNESVTSENNRPSKKKKGQRFFCTEFPPCQLSFTRSEHLARHIRKHTGERPFQCHCSRRFSRLDNLRQHAQTVHVNEDIPGDSLAATGTRFQRQIRTDRVRPTNGRSRASTLTSSHGSHSRGHSRNLSSSSVASTTSNMSQQDETRRRPATLAMANDGTARARLSLDTLSHPNMQAGQFQFGSHSPGGYSTPTSATFSTGTNSPRFSSALQSPIGPIPRSLTWGSRTPGRRLSVPSGNNPFQNPPTNNNQYLTYVPPLGSSTSSTMSGNSSMLGSPTSSQFSESRRDSAAAAEAEWRRRTWHPGTYTGILNGPRPATSGLSYYQTPDSPQPIFGAKQPQGQVTRLPGIESFDQAPPPASITRRVPSPMQIDPPHRAPPPGPIQAEQRSTLGHDERRNNVSWDLQAGINKLDIASRTPPRESRPWSYFQSPRSQPSPHRSNPPQPIYVPPPTSNPAPQNGPQAGSHLSEPPITPRKNKRHGWYHGPLPLTQQSQSSGQQQPSHRTSPEGSSSSEGVPTPSASSVGEYHPAIVHANGYVETRPAGAMIEDTQKLSVQDGPGPVIETNNVSHQPYQPVGPQAAAFALYQVQSQDRPQIPPLHPRPHHESPINDMRRLEALVAVATREDQAVHAR